MEITKDKMRINQGICLIMLSILVLVMVAYLEPLQNHRIDLIGWFLLGTGIARLNDYWGDRNVRQ